jgi:hypothetical protein
VAGHARQAGLAGWGPAVAGPSSWNGNHRLLIISEFNRRLDSQSYEAVVNRDAAPQANPITRIDLLGRMRSLPDTIVHSRAMIAASVSTPYTLRQTLSEIQFVRNFYHEPAPLTPARHSWSVRSRIPWTVSCTDYAHQLFPSCQRQQTDARCF